MFRACPKLVTVDISGIDLTAVDNADATFYGDSSLKTIYVDADAGDLTNASSHSSVLEGCTSIVGGLGTTYKANIDSWFFAHVDGGSGNPGYFTAFTEGLMYNSNTDTLYICGKFSLSDLSNYKSTTKKIVTKDGAVLPASCNELFSSFTALESADLSRADLSQITSMRGMFKNSAKLSEVSWGNNANTGNITNMQNLFYNCSALKNPHTEQLNTGSVTSMYNMFYGCTSLEKLDLSSFSTSGVTSMSGMFRKSSALTTIIVGDSWNTANVTSSGNMFTGCTALVGGIGTKYNSGKIDKTYAHVDTVSAPGYLTANHPVFVSNSMTLGGAISLNFYVAPSGLTETNLPKTYIVFDVNGKQQTAKFDANKMNSKKTAYGFTCMLNSVSMADDVKATLYYYDSDGEEQSVTSTSTAETYLNKFNSDDNEKLWNLIKGINDYGYYMQKYLSKAAASPWTLGVDHKAMSTAYTKAPTYQLNRDTYLSEMANLKKEATPSSDIERFNYALSLDSDTSLIVKIKPKSTYKGSISVKVTDASGKTTTVTPVKLSDGRYQITINNISAHKLADMYTVTVKTTNGTSNFKASALTYAYEGIQFLSEGDEYNAMCALYEYYKASKAYKG